ncbi:MAG: helix-turn-helix transcriptional regulator [Gammaproteobacteria bacterium]
MKPIKDPLFDKLSFENIIANIPGSLWLKDLNLRYVECNQDSLNLFGIPAKDFILEKNDFDMPWADHAAQLRANDQQVIKTQKSYAFIQTARMWDGKEFIVVSHKSPFRDATGNVLGVMGFDTLFQTPKITEAIKKLHFTDTGLLSLHRSLNPTYILCDDFSIFNLTEREGHCLFYLVRGKTSKEISEKLYLSTRTIEQYTDNIKVKFNCKKNRISLKKQFSWVL